MTAAGLVPDRRRTRLPLNGGKRPTEPQRAIARNGITAARGALTATHPEPDEPATERGPRISVAQQRRARAGLADARAALRRTSDLAS